VLTKKRRRQSNYVRSTHLAGREMPPTSWRHNVTNTTGELFYCTIFFFFLGWNMVTEQKRGSFDMFTKCCHEAKYGHVSPTRHNHNLTFASCPCNFPQSVLKVYIKLCFPALMSCMFYILLWNKLLFPLYKNEFPHKETLLVVFSFCALLRNCSGVVLKTQ
jgi:hypothetical protein